MQGQAMKRTQSRQHSGQTSHAPGPTPGHDPDTTHDQRHDNKRAVPALEHAQQVPTTQVLKTLRAGSSGTVRLERLYGESLLFVRHRLDPTRRLRYTTVELVVSTRRAVPYLRDKALYPVRIAAADHDTRRRLIDAGGEWNSRGRFWWLSGAKIRQLKLADKVMISLAKRR
jgi:hypothetical protein